MPSRTAIVQGEVHASETDRQALVEHGLEDCDAVLVEGRSRTIGIRRLTLGYAAFLMGYVTLMWMQAAIDRIRDRLSGRTPLRELADRAGVDYYDRIDADTDAVYEMCPDGFKYVYGAVLVGFLALTIADGLNRLLLVGFSLSVPYIYTTGCIVAVKFAGGGRVTHMADRITDIAETRSYDRVAVLCGDAHRSAVGDALREREWAVQTYGSRHPLVRLFGR